MPPRTWESVAAMDFATLPQYVSELDRMLGERAAAREATFQQVFKGDLRKLTAAMENADRMTVRAEVDERHRKLDVLCRAYLEASPEQRAEIRELAHRHKHVLHTALGHVGWAGQQIHAAEAVEWLRSGLAAACINDNRIDYRDMLLQLGSLYMAAAHAGIDPKPYFTEIAALANPVPHEASPSSMQHFLADFDRSAFFEADVKPRLRRNF